MALIRRLAAQRAAATAPLAATPARIGELAAELAPRGGPPKPPAHASTPPSKGWKRERPPRAGAQRGPPVGHPGTSRRRAAPDEIVLGQPTPWGACGHALAAGPQARIGGSQMVELPPGPPVVVAAWRDTASGPPGRTPPTAA